MSLERGDHRYPPEDLVLVLEDAHQAGLRGGAGVVFQQLHNGPPISRALALGHGGQGEFVARQFAVRHHPPEPKPQHRIEPMDNAQNGDEPLHCHVVPPDVAQFMKKNVAQFGRAESGRQVRRQQQPEPKQAIQRRSGHPPRLDQAQP